MLQKVEKEKRIADHLLYVSLKYTKTGDVILNLIERWRVMIEETVNAMLEKLKKKKDISSIPNTPLAKVKILMQEFRKEQDIKDTLELYMFFKRINQLEHIKENEFRKNVTLRVIDKGNMINIDLEKLKEWEGLLERFLSFARQFIK